MQVIPGASWEADGMMSTNCASPFPLSGETDWSNLLTERAVGAVRRGVIR